MKFTILTDPITGAQTKLYSFPVNSGAFFIGRLDVPDTHILAGLEFRSYSLSSLQEVIKLFGGIITTNFNDTQYIYPKTEKLV